MKQRQGFVSNSSSSSFLLYGFWMEGSIEYVIKDGKRCEKEDEYSESISDALYEKAKEYLMQYKWEEDKEHGKVDFYSVMSSKLIEDMGISVHYPEDGPVIGKSWDLVKDDQTGKEFKDEVQSFVDEYFPGYKCETHEFAWSD